MGEGSEGSGGGESIFSESDFWASKNRPVLTDRSNIARPDAILAPPPCPLTARSGTAGGGGDGEGVFIRGGGGGGYINCFVIHQISTIYVLEENLGK